MIAASPPLGRLGVPACSWRWAGSSPGCGPAFPFGPGWTFPGLPRDPAVVQTVLADPLFHRVGTARLSTEVVAAMRGASERHAFPLPVLVLHGSPTAWCRPRGVVEFMTRSVIPTTAPRIPRGLHVLFADADAERVLTDVERWIVARL